MPDMKIYEIEVSLILSFEIQKRNFFEQIMFWGLRECRSINLQSIQAAEVTIECAGAHITRTITDVQKFPNFESSEADKYKLRVV